MKITWISLLKHVVHETVISLQFRKYIKVFVFVLCLVGLKNKKFYIIHKIPHIIKSSYKAEINSGTLKIKNHW